MAVVIAGDFRAASQVVSSLGEATGLAEADLLALLQQVPDLPARYPAARPVEHRGVTIVWHDYEHLVWALGESFRRILKAKRSLRRSPALWREVEAVCLDSRYGKGRESFTMLLGQYGGRERVPVLLRLLDDPEVCGHAMYALRLLGAPDAVEPAQRLLESDRAWVRREAAKYLAKVGAR